MSMTVETHPLISIRMEASVQEAARLMTDRSIGALGVIGPRKEVIGIITERDLAWFVARGLDASMTVVAEIVNDFPLIVEGPLEVSNAIDRMRSAHLRHLLVREGADLRIVSMRDLVLER